MTTLYSAYKKKRLDFGGIAEDLTLDPNTGTYVGRGTAANGINIRSDSNRVQGMSIANNLSPEVAQAAKGGLKTGNSFGSGAGWGIAGAAAGIGAEALNSAGGWSKNTTTGRTKTGVTVGSSALSGAALGTSILPGWGTLIGGAVGAVYGVFAGGAQKKKAMRRVADDAANSNTMAQNLSRVRAGADPTLVSGVKGGSYYAANGGLIGPGTDLWNTNKTAYVDSTLSAPANRDKEWVKRLYQKNTPSIQVPGQPFRSTHLMGDDGQGYAYPTIVGKNGKLVHIGGSEDDQRDYAIKNNIGIQFPTAEKGSWFAANGYKQGTGVLQKAYGGSIGGPGDLYAPLGSSASVGGTGTGWKVPNAGYDWGNNGQGKSSSTWEGFDTKTAGWDDPKQREGLMKFGTMVDYYKHNMPTNNNYRLENTHYSTTPTRVEVPNDRVTYAANGGSIHINPDNKGKFNATKERTGKTTEELTHSPDPTTRERAIFAQNASHWKHAFGGYMGTGITKYGTDNPEAKISAPLASAFMSGGKAKSLSSDNALMVGKTHAEGGIDIPGVAEVEDGETTKDNYVFSKKLGFADLHKPIAIAKGKIEKKPLTGERVNSLKRLMDKEKQLAAQQDIAKQQLNLA